MKKIVFLDEYSINEGDLSQLIALGDYTGYYDTKPEEVVERAKDADVIISNKVKITKEIISQLPKLKLICVAATGMNNIDLDAAAERGIPVKNAKGYSTHSVAETTIGGALGLMREIVYYDQFVKGDNGYKKSTRQFNYDRPTHQLYGKKWGIIGLGAIGRRVAELATVFGYDVAYYSTSGTKREEQYPEKTLGELLSWSDIISIHAPLNERTNNLISSNELAQMKPTAIIINVARGGIINEGDLAEALNNNVISGAALDVFTQEPINADNPLFTVKDKYKLLLSPHNAWSADSAVENLIECIAQNIREFYAI